MSVRSKVRGFLVIPENWDDGWQLSVNGKREEVVRAFMAYIGVPIQPGVSKVYLSYSDYPLLVGLWVSGVTLFSLVVLNIICAVRADRESDSDLPRHRQTPC